MSDWADIHKGSYAESDWIDMPSLFAQTAIAYFPKEGRILELGAGQGQDTRYFAEHGYDVVSTDLEQTALDLSKEKLSEELAPKVTLQKLDIRERLPFEDESFDVIYAHLSLHYFDAEITKFIFDEAYRVLKKGGIFACFTNSASDPEYGMGEEIEKDYFRIGKLAKRYFTEKSMRHSGQYFEIKLLDNLGETYKDSAKDVHNLIRYIGTRPEQHKFSGLAIACTGAIIEREAEGKKEVLIQTRWQPGFDKVYSGTIEFPIGRLDVEYENVFDALAREIKEETGLTLKSIRGEDKTGVLTTGKDDAAIGFRPFCCTQQLKNGRPWVSFIFVCSVEPGEPVAQLSESKDVRWIEVSELRDLYKNSPEQFFGLELPAWEYYFKQ